MKARVCLLLAGVLAVGACSDSDPTAEGADTTSGVVTTSATTTAEPATTAAPPTSPTTVVPDTTEDPGSGAEESWSPGEISTEPTECAGTAGGQTIALAPTLMVVDRASGEVRWQMCGDRIGIGRAAVEAGGVVVYNGSIAAADAESESGLVSGLIGFDAATGEPLWWREEGSAIVGASDDVVYLRGSSPEGDDSDPGTVLDPVIGIDARTGDELWRVDDLSLALFPDSYGDTFVVAQAAEDLALRAFEAETGEERWHAEALGPFAVRDAGVVVVRGDLLAGGETAVLDPATGQDVWSAPGHPIWASDDTVYVTSVPARVQSGPFPVEARSLSDGTVLATFDRPGPSEPTGFEGALDGTPGNVLFAFDGNGLVAVDGVDGAILRSLAFASPAALDGETVAGASQAPGAVSLTDARSGSVAAEVAIPCLVPGGGCAQGFVMALALSDDNLLISISNVAGN